MRSAAQAIFRNDGITTSEKRRYIAVRFRCRADSCGRSIARLPPYNSLYERGKTAILSPLALIPFAAATTAVAAVAAAAANPRRR